MNEAFKKDRQTVTPEEKSVLPLIHDVRIRSAVTHPDERGTICGFIIRPGTFPYRFDDRLGW